MKNKIKNIFSRYLKYLKFLLLNIIAVFVPVILCAGIGWFVVSLFTSSDSLKFLGFMIGGFILGAPLAAIVMDKVFK